MVDLEAFLTELRAVVKDAWPDVSAVWESEHVARVPRADLSLPYAVIGIPSFPAVSPSAGALTLCPTVQFYCVGYWAGPNTVHRRRVLALLRKFWPTNPLTTAEVAEVVSLSYGLPDGHHTLFGDRGAVDVNEDFAKSRDGRHACMVQIKFALQETP